MTPWLIVAALLAPPLSAIETHIQGLVDARAVRLGGPTWGANDPRLATLRAMVRTVTARPDAPLHPAITDAATLDAMWGGSTAVFTVQLMEATAKRRPGLGLLDAPACHKLCAHVLDVIARDTIAGIKSQGWPIDATAEAEITAGAKSVDGLCRDVCGRVAIPNATCVEQIARQDELMQCWPDPRREIPGK